MMLVLVHDDALVGLHAKPPTVTLPYDPKLLPAIVIVPPTVGSVDGVTMPDAANDGFAYTLALKALLD